MFCQNISKPVPVQKLRYFGQNPRYFGQNTRKSEPNQDLRYFTWFGVRELSEAKSQPQDQGRLVKLQCWQYAIEEINPEWISIPEEQHLLGYYDERSNGVYGVVDQGKPVIF